MQTFDLLFRSGRLDIARLSTADVAVGFFVVVSVDSHDYQDIVAVVVDLRL